MRKIGDFAAAFFITAGVLLCIALVSQADFFEDAVKWNGKEHSIEIFDSVYVFEKSVPEKLDALLSVNDVFTFRGFSSCLEGAAAWTAEYIKDIFSIAFTAAKEVTATR